MSRKNRVALLILFLLPSLRLGAQVVSHFVPPKIKRSVTGTVAGNISHGFVAKQQPRIHFIGASSQKPISVHSTISASKGTISISATLGEVIPQKFTSAVAGEKKQFSQLSWVGLHSEKLPQGMIFRLVGDSGKPEIPSIVVTCAVPETAKNFRATITERTQKNISSIFLPPAPPIVNSTFGARTFDESRYVSSLPGDQPIVSRPIRFRKLRLVSVTIPLAEYRKNFSVIAKTKFRCELSFDLETPLQKNIASKGDPIFDDVYASLVANPGDIRAFEGSFHPINNSKILSLAASKPITFDSSVTGWIDQSAPYIKLTVTRTGLYRSTIQELVNRSGNNSISNWKASELRLINRGKEVSLWIDTTPDGRINAIEFYGKRLKGDPGQYYNRDTDSNAYWLTTSNKLQNPPLRYTPYVSSQTPTSTIAEATLSQHHERDYNYYPGDKNFDESQTTQRYLWISGEGFVWRNTQDSLTSVVDTFYMPSLPAIQTGKQALITASVRGISTGATGSVTHQCAIILNGKEITNASFSDFDSLHIQSLVPLSELHSGANTIAMMYRQGNGICPRMQFT